MNGTDAPTRPGSLILDVYGAYLRQLGNWAAVADLVTLVGELGVTQQAVRSAVSRMTRHGLLVNERRAGVSGYRLSPDAMPMMERGDRRIFSMRSPASLADGWVLVVFSVPETERAQRHQLRRRLTWLGFGNLANGVWIAPRRTKADLTIVLEQFALTPYAQVFDASYEGFADVAEMVAASWDLDWLSSLYAGFLRDCRPVLARWARRGARDDDRRAFVDYSLLLHAWRKLPYLDPGLPSELLPRDWAGRAAADAFFGLRDRLEPPRSPTSAP